MKYDSIVSLIVFVWSCINLFEQYISKNVEFETIKPFREVRIDTIVKNMVFRKTQNDCFFNI